MSSIHAINVIIMCQVLIVEHLFCPYLEKRSCYPIRILFSSLVCAGIAYVYPTGIWGWVTQGTFMYVSLLLISIGAMLVCYQDDPWVLIFCGVSSYTIQHIGSELNGILDSWQVLRGAVLTSSRNLVIGYLLAVICSFTIIYGRVMKGRQYITINNKQLLLISWAAIFIDVFLGLLPHYITEHYTPGIEQYPYRMIQALYDITACIVVLCLMFASVSNKKLSMEIELMQQMLEEEKRHYQISKDTIEMINLKCHDLKHQIRTLRKTEGEVDRNTLKEIENVVNIYDAVNQTGNTALDVILTEKSLLCEKNGIHMTTMVQHDILHFMADADIYVLFGNALDNAIEALSNVKDPDKRTIGLYVQTRNKMISIHVENYYRGTLEIRDGLPLTSKEDKGYHGFGIRSMQLIANKYHGWLTASAQDQVFHLNVILPIA